MSNDTRQNRTEGAYVDGDAAGDVLHDRVSAATRTTESGSELLPQPGPELPYEGADLPGTSGPRARRRRFTIAAALVSLAVVAVALALFVPRPVDSESARVSTPEGWNGDWKDELVGDGASQPYSGDWKDVLVGDGASQPYSGDWKDAVVDETTRSASTGDWKDLIAE